MLSALTLGDKSHLDKNLKGAYSLTGASHVLAVSGLHVGVVFIFSNFFLGLIFIRKFKRWRYVPLLFVLWGYAFVTGMSPSVVRATIMISMMVVGLMTGRKGVTYNTIAASALLMLIYNPLYITDIGFQLSYTAVFSIVLLQDKISSLLNVKNVFLKKVWDLTAVSIAAQIGTLPITLYYFHQLPLLSCIVSLFVVPAASAVIYLSFMMVITAPFDFISDSIAFLLNIVLKAMNATVNAFENIPHSTVQNISFEGSDLILLLTLSASVCFYIKLRRHSALVLALSCILALAICNTGRYYNTANQHVIAVHNVQGKSVINVIDGFQNTVISQGDCSKAKHKIRRLQNKLKTDEPEYIAGNSLEISGKRLYLLNYKISGTVTKKPLRTDYLIIGGETDIPSGNISDIFDFCEVIIDSSNSKRQIKQWKQYFAQYNITPYFTSDKGAYFVSI